MATAAAATGNVRRPGLSSATFRPAPARDGYSTALTLLVLIGGSILMAVVTAMHNPQSTLMVGLVVLVAGTAAVCLAPTRYALFVLTFLGLVLDITAEGPWDSPLAPLGTLWMLNLNKTVPVDVPVSGGAALALLLFAVQRYRALTTGTAYEGTKSASPIRMSMWVGLMTIIVLSAWGWVRGGDLQMAKNQVQVFLLSLLLAQVTAAAFRAPDDYRILGRLIVLAACIKAMVAVYVSIYVMPLFERLPEYATSHGDSLLFAIATVLLIVRLAEQPSGKAAFWCVALLPIIGWGMIANDRRLVWVQILASLIMFWMISRRSRAKRVGNLVLLALSPFILAYMAAGWNSQSPAFSPVQSLKSTGAFGGQQEMDSSTLYREMENYDLMMTMRFGGALLGTGLGKPFLQPIPLPNISFFREYQFLPHNSILGMWAFTGALGFSGICLVFVASNYLARRSYLAALTADQRIGAIMVHSVLMIHAIHCWGDIGFTERKSAYLVGPAIALAGQLAVATGAWRPRTRKKAA